MMRFAILLVVMGLCAQQASAQTYLSGTTAMSAAGAGCTTSAIDTTGASTIVVTGAWAMNSGAWGSAGTLTDSCSNTWTNLGVAYGYDWAGHRLFCCNNPTTSAAHTFTLTTTGSYQPQIVVMAFAGTTFEAARFTSGLYGTTLSPASPVSTAKALVIISSMAGDPNGTQGSITAPTGYSGLSISNSAGYKIASGMAYKFQGSIGTEQPGWTYATGNFGCVALATAAPITASGPTVTLTAGGSISSGTLSLTGGSGQIAGYGTSSSSGTLYSGLSLVGSQVNTLAGTGTFTIGSGYAQTPSLSITGSQVRYPYSIGGVSGSAYCPSASDVWTGVLTGTTIGTLSLASTDLKWGTVIHSVTGSWAGHGALRMIAPEKIPPRPWPQPKFQPPQEAAPTRRVELEERK